mmetsp:Transcript_4713/g.11469  ORF Transcript_4713/g.11469 Transcript_4713/m.11469 type:complete len:152 (-) Transcript_4713:493-948(-)|eukprot:CAMPEP_0172409776 /NCGR_PEP_ID=MMETSP1061-20121228/76534_1 /TAXON_ID=37318 /ORGANISM="Pseudo-nitzschia pungens, Strain cf. pungens" /LENGTH=151 /DNA_ID=CAMNT_0013145941 /DNA_START=166 /DNA_END=621 /DNA_ORIENTATION=-
MKLSFRLSHKFNKRSKQAAEDRTSASSSAFENLYIPDHILHAHHPSKNAKTMSDSETSSLASTVSSVSCNDFDDLDVDDNNNNNNTNENIDSAHKTGRVRNSSSSSKTRNSRKRRIPKFLKKKTTYQMPILATALIGPILVLGNVNYMRAH